MTVQSCPQNPGVIQDQQVVGAQQVRKFLKGGVYNDPSGAIKAQHAGGTAVGERLFRDQFVWKVVVEVGNQHRAIMTYWNRSPPRHICPAERDRGVRCRSHCATFVVFNPLRGHRLSKFMPRRERSFAERENWVTIEVLGRTSPAFRLHEDRIRSQGRNRPLWEIAAPDWPCSCD